MRAEEFRKRKFSKSRSGILFCILLYSVLLPYWFLWSWVSCICLFVFTHNTNIQAPGGIRTQNPGKRSAADFRSLAHCFNQLHYLVTPNNLCNAYTLFSLWDRKSIRNNWDPNICSLFEHKHHAEWELYILWIFCIKHGRKSRDCTTFVSFKIFVSFFLFLGVEP